MQYQPVFCKDVQNQILVFTVRWNSIVEIYTMKRSNQDLGFYHTLKSLLVVSLQTQPPSYLRILTSGEILNREIGHFQNHVIRSRP